MTLIDESPLWRHSSVSIFSQNAVVFVLLLFVYDNSLDTSGWPGQHQFVCSPGKLCEIKAMQPKQLLSKPAIKGVRGGRQSCHHLFALLHAQMVLNQVYLPDLQEPDRLPGDAYPLKTAGILLAARSLQDLTELSPGCLLAWRQRQYDDKIGSHSRIPFHPGKAYRAGASERMPPIYRAPIV
jgi:hypothetical protein